MAGREILRKGIGWLIGNGQSINVWNDPWLSSSTQLTPIGPPPRHLVNLKVAHLIMPERNQWNIERIRRFLPSYEDTILKIPLSSVRHEDVCTWLPVKSGQYSTRTGYALTTIDETTPTSEEFNWQRCVWRIRSQPKIQTFIWKAISGALPVGEQLLHRGVHTDATCRRCGQLETMEHVLFNCNFAQEVWSRSPIHGLQPTTFQSLSHFFKIAPKLINLPPSGVSEAALYAWICWNIWLARNQLIFNNRVFTADETIIKSISDARCWQEAQLALPKKRLPAPTTQTSSLPPFPGPVCHVDAAWKKDSSLCGMGFVFEANLDPSEAEFSLLKENVSSPLAAEAYAVIAALQQALDCGFRELRLFSDAQVLVKLVNDRGSDNSISNLLLDIRVLIAQFHVFSLVYISRELNTRADSLAKLAFVTQVGF